MDSEAPVTALATAPSRAQGARPPGGATKDALSRDGIVDRALELADSESLDAVTVRRLAQEFDVTPMALYWHVKNKEELLNAMADRMLASALAAPGDPASATAKDPDWAEQLRSVMDRIIAALRRHPGAASLVPSRILQSTDGLRLTEYTLQLLFDAGFSVTESADIARTALQTAIMLVSAQGGAEWSVPADEREAVIEQKRQAVAALPAELFPRLRECIRALTDCEDDEAYFDSGTDLFVSGVVARQARLATREN
jgi:AcrR family transcriptional regulator